MIYNFFYKRLTIRCNRCEYTPGYILALGQIIPPVHIIPPLY